MSDKDTLFVFCADTHCGSSLGLMTPEPFQLHDGGEYYPSPLQRMIWNVWEEGWNRVAELRKGKRLVVIHNGDATEGMHHQTTQVISGRVEEHEDLHITCMDYGLRKAKFEPKDGDKLYYVSGTEEHSGNGSRSEERIANDLDGVVRFSDNRATWDHIVGEVNGKVIDVSHHGGTAGNSILTDNSPLYSRLKVVYTDCLEHDQKIPRLWVRAHLHRYVHTVHEGAKGIIDGFILPSFQCRTGYVYRRFNNRKKPSDIGMVLATISKNGDLSYETVIQPIEQDSVVRI